MRHIPWRRAGLQVLLLIASLTTGMAAEAQSWPPYERPSNRPWPWPWQQPRDIHRELVVRYAPQRICRTTDSGRCTEWDTVLLRGYNGRLVGPTLEARPGDTLHILVDNQLPAREPRPPRPGGTNLPHDYNTTNLHTHGLHVSPSGNSDNVLISLPPGRKFEYEVKIPRDHYAGTFWYHPHKHGSVAMQIASGMAGALIIRGDIDEVPSIAAAREQIFVFQQLAYTEVENPYQPGQRANMVEDFVASFGALNRWRQLGKRTTINGEVEPTLHLRPGEVQRWRFIHAGTSQPIRPKLVREQQPLAVVEQHLIALDGITTGRVEPVQEVELHPGYRADVMIRVGDRPDRYLLVDEEYEEGDPRRVLARLIVAGRRVNMELPTAEELAPLAPLQPIMDHEVAGRPEQEARFSVDFNVTPPTPPRFLLNGNLFDPSAPPLQVELGKADQWVLSSGRELGHPFHIHVNPFQIMTDDGKVVWKDTLFIPPGKEIRIRTRYERYIGRFVMHCHILDHEDLGMMQQVEIVIPGDEGHGHDDQNASSRR